MDRRNFIGTLLAVGAGFTVLPGAGRLWIARRQTPRWKFVEFGYPGTLTWKRTDARIVMPYLEICGPVRDVMELEFGGNWNPATSDERKDSN